MRFWGESCVWALTLDNFQVADCYVILFVVRYSSNPMSKKCHFGHIGGADLNIMFVLWRTAPVFALKSREHRNRLSSPSILTLWEIMTDGRFESDIHVTLKKPDFFGDAIAEHDRILYDGDYKWLRQIRDKKFLSSQHRKNVSLGVSVTHVGTPHYRVRRL